MVLDICPRRGYQDRFSAGQTPKAKQAHRESVGQDLCCCCDFEFVPAANERSNDRHRKGGDFYSAIRSSFTSFRPHLQQPSVHLILSRHYLLT